MKMLPQVIPIRSIDFIVSVDHFGSIDLPVTFRSRQKRNFARKGLLKSEVNLEEVHKPTQKKKDRLIRPVRSLLVVGLTPHLGEAGSSVPRTDGR